MGEGLQDDVVFASYGCQCLQCSSHVCRGSSMNDKLATGSIVYLDSGTTPVVVVHQEEGQADARH